MGNKEDYASLAQMPIQSTVEFLTVYGWAILVVVIAAVLLFVFALAPANIPPYSCTISSGISCKAILINSNTITESSLLLSNSQEYPVENVMISINAGNAGSASVTCIPDYVLPGGSILCSLILSGSAAGGHTESGSINLTAYTCTEVSGSCSSTILQRYTGTFFAKVSSGPIASLQPSVHLSAQATRVPAGLSNYPVVATVEIFGYPLEGATVEFSAERAPSEISTEYENTNSNGNATVYISRQNPGNVLVTGTFATVSNSIYLQFYNP